MRFRWLDPCPWLQSSSNHPLVSFPPFFFLFFFLFRSRIFLLKLPGVVATLQVLIHLEGIRNNILEIHTEQ